MDTLRSQAPVPPPTDTIDKKVEDLNDEMMSILDRKDLDDRDKVTLYNKVLQRHNALSDKRAKEPGSWLDESSSSRITSSTCWDDYTCSSRINS